jgi:hypothetical protein
MSPYHLSFIRQYGIAEHEFASLVRPLVENCHFFPSLNFESISIFQHAHLFPN